jgi:Protein of unknown function (DUF1552)
MPLFMNRRSLLRAAGVAIALPLLEPMRLFSADGAASGQPINRVAATGRRMVAICSNLGWHPPSFFPTEAGKDYEPTEYLALLQDLRDDFTVISGMSHPEVRGGHEVGCSFLTGAPFRQPFKNTISVDQVLAGQLLGVTRESYLNLSTSLNGRGHMMGGLSFTASGVGLPAIGKPSELFARLFLSGGNEAKTQQARIARGHSVLDAVTDQAKRLRASVGASDRDKLEEYFGSVRDLEQKLTAAESWATKPKPTVSAKAPVDISEPPAIIDRIAMMYDLTHLALQTDSTRVITLFVQDGGGVPKIPGVSMEHHELTHHSKNEEKIEQLRKHELPIMQAFHDFLAKLKATKEGDRTLLDNTAVISGCFMGEAAKHNSVNLPMIIAGGGFKHAGHLAFDKEHNKPLCNLYLSVLQRTGLEIDKFSSSTGTVTGLEMV